jgi:polyhydroxyalkanoate synthesis regulator phasin
MLEDVRRGVRAIVEAGISAVSGALTPSRARDLARSIAQGEGVEQINRVAQDLLDWSQRSREWIAEIVQREVKGQLSSAGIATREDLDALRKRVRDLERSSGKPASSSTRSRSTKTSGAAPSSPKPSSVETGAEPTAGVGDLSPSGP